jgi:hypothetical protein
MIVPVIIPVRDLVMLFIFPSSGWGEGTNRALRSSCPSRWIDIRSANKNEDGAGEGLFGLKKSEKQMAGSKWPSSANPPRPLNTEKLAADGAKSPEFRGSGGVGQRIRLGTDPETSPNGGTQKTGFAR